MPKIESNKLCTYVNLKSFQTYIFGIKKYFVIYSNIFRSNVWETRMTYRRTHLTPFLLFKNGNLLLLYVFGKRFKNANLFSGFLSVYVFVDTLQKYWIEIIRYKKAIKITANSWDENFKINYKWIMIFKQECLY